MDPFKDYYMDPDFDPWKVTMPRLREIFLLNGVHYTGNERKADLVKLFDLHIRPLIPELQRKEEELKRKAETQLRSVEKKKRQRSRSPEVTKTPGTPKTAVKTGRSTGRSKQRSRGKVTFAEEEENIPSTPTPTLPSQPLEPLAPDDDVESTAPVVKMSRDDQIANNKKRDVSSEDKRAKGQTHPAHDVLLSNAPKLYPEISKSSNEEEHQHIRRDAIAYAYRNPNYISRSQINRLLPPEVDFSALEPSSSRGWLIIFTILLFLVGAALMMVRIRVEVGFCDSGDLLSNNTVSDVFEMPESDKEFIESNCTPCPPYGHCSDGKLVSCDEGYTISSSSFDFLGPFTSSCVVDLNRVQKIEKYVRLLKDVAAVETGRIKCGAGGNELAYFESLKERLRARKPFSQESAEDFEKYLQFALEKLRDDEDVEVSIETNGLEEHVCIISRKPFISLFCRAKNHGIDFLRENTKMIFVCFIGFLIILGLIFYIKRKKWEAYQVRRATDTVLNLMKQNREIVSEQWRESVMHEVTDDLTRIYLWKRVEERLQENPLVRTRRLDDYKGRRSLQWDWLGEKHAIY